MYKLCNSSRTQFIYGITTLELHLAKCSYLYFWNVAIPYCTLKPIFKNIVLLVSKLGPSVSFLLISLLVIQALFISNIHIILLFFHVKSHLLLGWVILKDPSVILFTWSDLYSSLSLYTDEIKLSLNMCSCIILKPNNPMIVLQ